MLWYNVISMFLVKWKTYYVPVTVAGTESLAIQCGLLLLVLSDSCRGLTTM